jgi:O-methyltransferase involved in polyketide biosynthesis
MQQLTGVEETLLIPLLARARETRRWNGIVRDRRAVALVEHLDYDFSGLKLDALTQLCVALRTEILDDAARKFLQAHPNALVLNLGAGLDTRFHRLDNGQLLWVDVDLPAAADTRRRLLPPGDRNFIVAGSVLEDGWLAELPRDRPVLVIAEGLVMYFSEAETSALLQRLAAHFPGAEALVEFVSPAAAARSQAYFEQRKLATVWRSGLNPTTLAPYQVLERWRYFDRHPLRLGLFALARWVPGLRDLFTIVNLHI